VLLTVNITYTNLPGLLRAYGRGRAKPC